MAIDEIFECVDIATLHSGDCLCVRVTRATPFGGTGFGCQKIRNFLRDRQEHVARRKIRLGAQSELQCIQEVGKRGHHYGFEDLLVCKAMPPKGHQVLGPEFQRFQSELEGKI
jgi:hypothetical protein